MVGKCARKCGKPPSSLHSHCPVICCSQLWLVEAGIVHAAGVR